MTSINGLAYFQNTSGLLRLNLFIPNPKLAPRPSHQFHYTTCHVTFYGDSRQQFVYAFDNLQGAT